MKPFLPRIRFLRIFWVSYTFFFFCFFTKGFQMTRWRGSREKAHSRRRSFNMSFKSRTRHTVFYMNTNKWRKKKKNHTRWKYNKQIGFIIKLWASVLWYREKNNYCTKRELSTYWNHVFYARTQENDFFSRISIIFRR